eukprot:759003-Hanusia_phi.AAC.2
MRSRSISKWQWQYLFAAVLELLCPIPLCVLSERSLKVWLMTGYSVILCARLGVYISFWVSNSIVLVKAAYETRLRPHKARSTLEKHMLRWNLFLVGILAEVAQILAGKHQTGLTVRDTFSVHGIAFGLLTYLPASIIAYLTLKYHEEYCFFSWAIIGFAMAVTYANLLRQKSSTVGEAGKKLGQNVKRYVKEWERCLQATNSTEKASEGSNLRHDTGDKERRGSGGRSSTKRLHPDPVDEPQVTGGAHR